MPAPAYSFGLRVSGEQDLSLFIFLPANFFARSRLDRVMHATRAREQRNRRWAVGWSGWRKRRLRNLLELRVGRDGMSEHRSWVDVGDKVWVMFPNVRTGRSRKLAFRMHGTYVVKEWLHG
jgi:hypothetical protein